MSYIDKVSELQSIEAKSPTEDGKLAFLKNTMVPRRLENFDSITRDLDKIEKSGSTDRVNLYANFQLDEFHGRSYKVSMPELQEYTAKHIFEDQVECDENFDAEALKEKKFELVLGRDETLVSEFDKLEQVDSEHQAELERLEEAKADKFHILGAADHLEGGKVVPNTYLDENNEFKPAAGVHAEKNEETGNVTISHNDIVGLHEGWTAAYTCGGVAKNRHFVSSTTIREIVRLMLYGDPQYFDIIYYGALSEIPATVEEALQLMAPSAVTFDKLMHPGYTWDLAVDMTDKFPVVMMPEDMWDIPNLLATGGNLHEAPEEYKKHKAIECDGVWMDKPWVEVDSEGNEYYLSDQMVTEPDIKSTILTWTNPERETVRFKLWYVDQAVGEQITDHDSHKWSFRFKEV